MELFLSKDELLSFIETYDELSSKEFIRFEIKYHHKSTISSTDYYKIIFATDNNLTTMLIHHAGRDYERKLLNKKP
jgi:hypothetical protein